MRLLRIIRGLPGSGKSTLAHSFEILAAQNHKSCQVCEADMFMVDKNGAYKFDRNKVEMCHIRCLERARAAMKAETDEVVVSNTSVKHWEMEPYLALAIEFGYQVQEIIVKGSFGSVHDVPRDTIQKMAKNFES